MVAIRFALLHCCVLPSDLVRLKLLATLKPEKVVVWKWADSGHQKHTQLQPTLLFFMLNYWGLKSGERRTHKRRSDINISRVANAALHSVTLKPWHFPFSFSVTSNCQCAACKSCFAWSAAQPAVRTNWLIMTWCLSSSIFDEARVLLAAAGYEADFQPLSSLSSL